MKSPTNDTSKQGVHKSTKIKNIPTSYTYIVMYIIPEIYLTDTQLHQQFIFPIVPS